jgi:hypothetical protein
MIHLKTFESNTLDNLLDKISQSGYDSLTDWEKNYMNKFDTSLQHKMDAELNATENPDIDSKDTGEPINTNVEITDDKLKFLWDNLYDNDLDNFLGEYNIPPHYIETPWEKLSNDIKKHFQHFAVKYNLLEL